MSTRDDEVRETVLFSFEKALEGTAIRTLNGTSVCTLMIRGTAHGTGNLTILRPMNGAAKFEAGAVLIEIEAGSHELLFGREGYEVARTEYRASLD